VRTANYRDRYHRKMVSRRGRVQASTRRSIGPPRSSVGSAGRSVGAARGAIGTAGRPVGTTCGALSASATSKGVLPTRLRRRLLAALAGAIMAASPALGLLGLATGAAAQPPPGQHSSARAVRPLRALPARVHPKAAEHTPLPSAPQATVPVPPSSAYVLVDVGTANVLAGYREHVPLAPASLTKIVTALVAVGYLHPQARVPGTPQSADAYPNNVGIEKGVGWPLEDVLQSLLVFSANDAAYALAQRVSGSLAAFGPVMERAARQMGMSDNPIFHDPAGLDGSEGVDGGNLVSARDLAIAGRDLLSVPELAQIVSERSYSFVDPTGKVHDLPSMNYVFLESYIGAVGIKTGFTDRAGACIVAAATRKGRTMLAVVMNGYNSTQTAMDLLDQGFATPAASEKGTDRLPPVTLPSPPQILEVPGHASHPAATKVAQAGARPPHSAAASRSLHSHGGRATPLDRTAPLPTSRHGGLGTVMGSWLARLLVMAAGVAGLVAIWELAGANRSERRRRLVGGPDRSALAATFHGGRKRRRQLVDSYRRHERSASLAQPHLPPLPRRR